MGCYWHLSTKQWLILFKVFYAHDLIWPYMQRIEQPLSPRVTVKQWKHEHMSHVWPQQVSKANLHPKELELPCLPGLGPHYMEFKWIYKVVNHFVYCISSLLYFSAINQKHKFSVSINCLTGWGPLENVKVNMQFSICRQRQNATALRRFTIIRVQTPVFSLMSDFWAKASISSNMSFKSLL